MKPLVSVIVPCFNAQDFIKESLDAILSQTYLNFEVIIVDDGSTDKTIEIIKRYAEKMHLNPLQFLTIKNYLQN